MTPWESLLQSNNGSSIIKQLALIAFFILVCMYIYIYIYIYIYSTYVCICIYILTIYILANVNLLNLNNNLLFFCVCGYKNNRFIVNSNQRPNKCDH